MMLNLRRRLTYFVDFGYLHGLRYMGKRCGFTGKIVWCIILIVSAMSMSYIFVLTLNSFKQDVVIVNLDTAYLHWTNTFPAVSLCLARGYTTKKFTAYAEKHFKEHATNVPKKLPSYIKVLLDYMFTNPVTPIYRFDYCETANLTCGVDLDLFKRELVPQHCSQIMSDVEYLGRKYAKCEDLFTEHKTEMGTFYDFDEQSKHQLPMVYDRANLKRMLSLKYAELDVAHLVLFVHSPEQIPFVNMDLTNLQEKGIRYEYTFGTVEMRNSDDVRDIPIHVRGCRFPDERLPGSLFDYSFASCFSDLRIRVELATCNCTLPTSPVEYQSQYCDYQGLQCIANVNIAKMARALHNRDETKCMQSCIEMEINSVRRQKTPFSDDPTRMGEIRIDIQDMPTMRYQRNVAKTQLDLVVAVGGVMGLFFGASLLSLVEIVFILGVRNFDSNYCDN